MPRFYFLTLILPIMFLGACADTQGQNVYYSKDDVGFVREGKFGKIIDIRHITIKDENTQTGTVLGGIAGAGVGSQMGKGDGSGAAAIVGAIAGAVGGYLAERELGTHDGLDITVTLEDGRTITLSQYIEKEDAPLKIGQRVLVQTMKDVKSREYMRVLPAEHIPDKTKKPKK